MVSKNTKKNIARFALTAAVVAVTAAPMFSLNNAPDEEEYSPVVHVGTTMRTFSETFSLGPISDVGTNSQFVINDGRGRLSYLTLTFRVADDNLREVSFYDNDELIYETSLDDIVGTVNGKFSYDDEHSGKHTFRLEAIDGSGNTTTVQFTTEGNKIIDSELPPDSQGPYIFFADKDDTWYHNLEGEGYVGLVMVSDKTPYLLEDDDPWRPPAYGFSSRVFDEDLDTLELEVNGHKVFERKFEEREFDGRVIRNPAEVHIIYIVPKNGESYTIKVTATDSKGRVTVEERTVTAPSE